MSVDDHVANTVTFQQIPSTEDDCTPGRTGRMMLSIIIKQTRDSKVNVHSEGWHS